MADPVRPAARVAQRALALMELHHDDRLDAVHAARALVDAGEAPGTTLDPAEVQAIAARCAELRALFALRDVDGWAEALNDMLARWTVTPRLHHEGIGWHLHAEPADESSWDRWFAASTTLALAVLLTERNRPPGGLCAAPGCARPFLETARGMPRRYCSQRCANRARVASHRSRGGATS